MANSKKNTTTYRQAKSIWEIRCEIPDRFRDQMPATAIAFNPPDSIASKVARSLTLAKGTELVDEEYGYLWEVVKVRGYLQRMDSRKKGRAPIAWIRLISLSPD